MVFGAILAGGVGRRMNGAVPKQLLEVGGEPIIVRSVRAFTEADMKLDGVIVVSAADYAEQTLSVLKEYGVNGFELITGGEDRSGSVMKAVEYVLTHGGSRDDILLTHDAARPFVTGRMIAGCAEDTRICGCAGTGIPATDTIFRTVDGEFIESMPPRTQMYQMQTPQGFVIGSYLDCWESLTESDRAEVTDACGVFLRAGKPVRVTPGDSCNIKITRPADLALAEFLAQN